jgi:hypothetical protein
LPAHIAAISPVSGLTGRAARETAAPTNSVPPRSLYNRPPSSASTGDDGGVALIPTTVPPPYSQPPSSTPASVTDAATPGAAGLGASEPDSDERFLLQMGQNMQPSSAFTLLTAHTWTFSNLPRSDKFADAVTAQIRESLKSEGFTDLDISVSITTFVIPGTSLSSCTAGVLGAYAPTSLWLTVRTAPPGVSRGREACAPITTMTYKFWATWCAAGANILTHMRLVARRVMSVDVPRRGTIGPAPAACRLHHHQPPPLLCVTRTFVSHNHTASRDGRAPFARTRQYLTLPATSAVVPPALYAYAHLQPPVAPASLVPPFDFHAHAHIPPPEAPCVPRHAYGQVCIFLPATPATPTADPHSPPSVVASSAIAFTFDSAPAYEAYGKPERTTTSVLRRDPANRGVSVFTFFLLCGFNREANIGTAANNPKPKPLTLVRYRFHNVRGIS